MNEPIQHSDGATPLKNTRHELFCQYYTGQHRRNATASYLAAGYKPRNPDVAATCACEILRFPQVQTRIKYLNDRALEVVKLHAREAVERLSVIATASISDFLDDAGNVDPAKVKHHPNAGAISDYTQRILPDGSVVANIKLKDDQKAIQMLGLAPQDITADTSNSQQVLIIKV